MQEGDVLLFQTPDGGDIEFVAGQPTMAAGLPTAVYLSLFGGNEDDDGRDSNPRAWWGNVDEPDPTRRYRSETQYLLRALAPTPANLRRIEDAAKRDLAWMLDRAASSVRVAASMPGFNRVRIVVTIEAEGAESRFEYVENWKADQ